MKHVTRVYDKIDPTDGKRKLFDMVTEEFIPSLSPKEGLEKFLFWINEMKTAGQTESLFFVSYGSGDFKILERNMKEQSLNLSPLVDGQFNAQKLVEKLAGKSKNGLFTMFNTFCPGISFRHHDALQDTLAMKRICETILKERFLTENYMIDFFLGNLEHIDLLVKDIFRRSMEIVDKGWIDNGINKVLNKEASVNIFENKSLRKIIQRELERRNTEAKGVKKNK